MGEGGSVGGGRVEGGRVGGSKATHIMTLLGERRGRTGLQEIFNPAKSCRTKIFCTVPTSQAQGDMPEAIVSYFYLVDAM